MVVKDLIEMNSLRTKMLFVVSVVYTINQRALNNIVLHKPSAKINIIILGVPQKSLILALELNSHVHRFKK